MPKKPHEKAKKQDSKDAVRITGKVVGFNISPKGHKEGVLVQTAKGLTQVNFAKHSGPSAISSLAVGAKLDVRAEPETAEGEHAVHLLVDEGHELSGVIASLNYARHGEVNGYLLVDGAFVHVKPDGARKLALEIGDAVRATGQLVRGADALVLEAETVQKQTGGKAKKSA